VSRHVDLHCHFIPPVLLELVSTEGAAHSMHLADDGTVSFADRDVTQRMPDGMLDLERRMAWMDAQEVDVQVLSAWMDFSAYVLDPADGAWLARALNECTVEAIANRSDRFRAMAAVPLQAPDLAAQELRYAIDELGMVAVEIATSVMDAELDDPALEPFWVTAEELGVLVLVHPYASIGSDRLSRYFLSNIVGNPAEETVAATHLVCGGVLERHPGLQVCLTHGGGFLPYQIGRQDRGFHAMSKVTAARVSAPPSTFLRRFLYDTVVHSPEALRFLVQRVGPDRVVLGSDYPFPMGDPEPVATVRAAGFDDATARAILAENAVAALGHRGATTGSERVARARPDPLVS
jgi:aminocarboxymuconate-semialdehyde decarboxylase